MSAPITLAELELEMSRLCQRRNERVDAARAIIKSANAEFDRVGIPLARKIERARLAEERAAARAARATPKPRHRPPRPHDPEWTPADIAHYYELHER